MRLFGPLLDYIIQVGDDFVGNLGAPGARDTVAVFLTQGESVTIKHEGDGANPLADPYLFLLNEAGSILAQNDDAIGTNSAVTYQATYTGYHYIRGRGFQRCRVGGLSPVGSTEWYGGRHHLR